MRRLTVTQVLVVRALLPSHRAVALLPPHCGVVRLAAGVLPVTYQNFKRLQEVDVLVLDACETAAGQRNVYRLSQHGHRVWAEHRRIAGTPPYNPSVDE